MRKIGEKIYVEYDIQFAHVGSCSATGYIAHDIGINEIAKVDYKNIILQIFNMTELSNLEMLKAFVEDLIYLQRMGVTIQLMNSGG